MTWMCVQVALLLIEYVKYTEKTAGHMCVHSEPASSGKSHAEGEHVCACCSFASWLSQMHRGNCWTHM